jgi:hypothetical protein
MAPVLNETNRNAVCEHMQSARFVVQQIKSATTRVVQTRDPSAGSFCPWHFNRTNAIRSAVRRNWFSERLNQQQCWTPGGGNNLSLYDSFAGPHNEKLRPRKSHKMNRTFNSLNWLYRNRSQLISDVNCLADMAASAVSSDQLKNVIFIVTAPLGTGRTCNAVEECKMHEQFSSYRKTI